MAEVSTDIYKSLQPQDPLKQPLSIMQLLGAVNQNRLFNQTYNARENIGNAYRANVDEQGNIDNRGLARDIGRTGGFLAGEGLGTATANATAQFANQKTQQNYLQQTLGALASKPDLNWRDVSTWAQNVARNTNAPPEMITSLLDGAFSVKNNPRALKDYITTQGIISLGTQALGGETGPPTGEGQPTQITTGEAIQRRTGVLPGSNTPQAAPRPGVIPQTGMVTGNAPGFEQAAAGSANLMASNRARAANFGSDIFPMMQALPALERLGPQGVGPGTEELNTIKSFVQSNLNWLPGADKIIGNPQNIKDYDEAKKYLTQLAGSRATMFGHGTDQALSTSLVGSPNTHISNLAGTDLLKATIALRRMEQAQTLDADDQKVQPGGYASWAAKWATNVDPRAYMVDLMTPDQLQRVAKSLKTKAEKDKFNRSAAKAAELGIITRPGGQHQPSTEE